MDGSERQGFTLYVVRHPLVFLSRPHFCLGPLLRRSNVLHT